MKNYRFIFSPLFLIAVLTTSIASAAPDYSTDVAPLLKKYCVGCHNGDDLEGDLSLETFADLQKGGENGPPLVAGESAKSLLIQLITGEEEPQMPPEDNAAPTAEEIAIIKAWVDAGAHGPTGDEPDRTTLVTPEIKAAEAGDRAITSMAYSPDGSLLAVAKYRRVDLLKASDQSVIRSFEVTAGKVNAVNFTADGKQLVTASGITGLSGTATLWNLATGEQVRQFVGHRDTMYDAKPSPDGKLLATCSYDKAIILWNLQTGEQLRAIKGHNGAVFQVAFSPDSQYLASASADATCKVWEVASGERLDTLSQPLKEQYAVTFSPDGNYIIAGGADKRLRVWKFVSRGVQKINPIVYARFAHEAPVTAIAMSRDGRALVSVAEDRTLKVWETETFTQRHLYETQSDETVALAVSPSGKEFVVGRMDGVIKNYPVLLRKPTSSAVATVLDVRPAADADIERIDEVEPNNVRQQAMDLPGSANVHGVIYRDSASQDEDLFRFESKAGEQWVIETKAAKADPGSPLDTKIEVLDAEGQPIVRKLLQAVRDSYFTFRGKNSSQSDDFRLHNWSEMNIDDLLYASGEVIKLSHYPRGPDSGFNVYPGYFVRHTFFDTTATSHALGETSYIVEPHAPGTELIPNGLPTFKVYYENDDESTRKMGTDSKLTFTAPADGTYLIRLRDARGFQGKDYRYELTLRPRQPDFKVRMTEGANSQPFRGSSRLFKLMAERLDGFDGEIRVDVEGLPPGFTATTPLIIEPGHFRAYGTITAAHDAPVPTADVAKTSKITATATIAGKEITHEVNNLGEIKLAEKEPELLVRLLPSNYDDASGDPFAPDAKPVELTIHPGETITAKVRVKRQGFDGGVFFGGMGSGRNLPFGVYVDNTGLNGVYVPPGATERTIFITADRIVKPQSRTFFMLTDQGGKQGSLPVTLKIVARTADSETVAKSAE